MTPEETFKLNVKIQDYLNAIQAEKSRADKAEEMVAGYQKVIGDMSILLLESSERIKRKIDFIQHKGALTAGIAKEIVASILEQDDLRQTAQAYNKRKCDEIVGKIEAEIDSTLVDFHALGLTTQKRTMDYQNGLKAAIDILKSVLGGKG